MQARLDTSSSSSLKLLTTSLDGDSNPNRQVCPSMVAVAMFAVFVLLQIMRQSVRFTPGIIFRFVMLVVTAQVLSQVAGHLASIVIIFVTMCHMYLNLPSPLLPVDGKAILITGCDQGIGHELAKRLDSLGFQVFAGMLVKNGPGEKKLMEACSPRLATMQLDVCDVSQVQEAVDFVRQRLGQNKLWGIVNNAGICYVGNVEMMTREDMQKIMDVNYFGPVNICKAFLPFLRRSRGRLVNIASNAGLAPVPLMGAYCASKAALASMTEVWRYELQAWGIHVSTIVPSGYKTGILSYDKEQTAERWWKAANDNVRKDYGKDCFFVKYKTADHESVLQADLSPICNAATDALLAKSPRPHYYRGILSRALPFFYLHLPTCLGDLVLRIIGNWFECSPQALKRNPQRA